MIIRNASKYVMFYVLCGVWRSYYHLSVILAVLAIIWGVTIAFTLLGLLIRSYKIKDWWSGKAITMSKIMLTGIIAMFTWSWIENIFFFLIGAK